MNRIKFLSKITYAAALAFAITFTFFACSSDDGDGGGGEKSGTFTDSRDSESYKWVKIGNQTWMGENLRYTQNLVYGDLTNGKGCGEGEYYYDTRSAKTACPAGWHLPSNAEWTTLMNTAGGESTAGKKLIIKKYGGTDDYGFSASPTWGYGRWWSSDEYSDGDGIYWHTYGDGDSYFGKDHFYFLNCCAVRCIKN